MPHFSSKGEGCQRKSVTKRGSTLFTQSRANPAIKGRRKRLCVETRSIDNYQIGITFKAEGSAVAFGCQFLAGVMCRCYFLYKLRGSKYSNFVCKEVSMF